MSLARLGLVLYGLNVEGEEVIRDVLEGEPKEILRCLKAQTSGGKDWPTDHFGEGVRVMAYVPNPDGATVVRDVAVTLATPKGCRKVRPCVDGVDLLDWEPAPVVPARLDADGTAEPLSRLVGHVPLDGNCHGPPPADEYRAEGMSVRLTPPLVKRGRGLRARRRAMRAAQGSVVNVRDLGALAHMFDD